MASTTVLEIIEDVARELAALRKGTFTATTTSLLTIANDPQFRSSRTNLGAGLAGTEVLSTSGAVAVPNPNTIASHDWAAGTLTPGITYTTKPDNTASFSLFLRGLTRQLLLAALNRALDKMSYTDRIPLSMVDDADMEVVNTSSWTAVTTSLSKVAGRSGRRAMRAANSGANGYFRPAQLEVDPVHAHQWLIAAEVRAETGTARLVARDATNSLDITTVDWPSRGWGFVWLDVHLPATCELLEVRLSGVGASDICEWDNLTVIPQGAQLLSAPASVEHPNQIRRVVRRSLINAIDRPGWRPYTWSNILHNTSSQGTAPDFAPSPVSIELRPTSYAPIYIDVDRPHPAVTADSDIVFVYGRWVKQHTLVETLRELSALQPGQESTTWSARLTREERRLARMNLNLTPPIQISYGFRTPPHTPVHSGGY
jgi:hypothetical protein